MAISFEAIGQKMVTFAAGTGLAEGKVCKISANGTVGPCSEEGFCGVVSQIRGGAAGVILEGYVELSYAGSTAAFARLRDSDDGQGGRGGSRNKRQNVPDCERGFDKQENRSVFIRGKEHNNGF